jgi:multiple sugar transport system permease protein
MATITATTRPRGRLHVSRPRLRSLLKGLLFISPALVGLAFFTILPMVQSLYYSFTDYNVLQPPFWVGLENYQALLKDRVFGIALRNTLIMVLIALPIHIIFDLAMAFLLNTKIRGLPIYRTIFYIPSITPVVASAIVWLWIFNGQYGILNVILRWFGVQPIGWLADPNWVKPALIFMGAWFGGNTILIYLAGLQEVPPELIEAADLDGASAWQKTWSVTLPMISPVIFYTLVISIIGYFQYFTEAWVMTANRSGAAGGPANSALFYAMYLYQNAFQQFKMGYASSMAWVLFVIVLVVTALLFFSSRFWVHYHAESN